MLLHILHEVEKKAKRKLFPNKFSLLRHGLAKINGLPQNQPRLALRNNARSLLPFLPFWTFDVTDKVIHNELLT